MVTNVLNPRLYQSLVDAFGDVRVDSRGVQAQIQQVMEEGRVKVRIRGGEYYSVNCPMCGDRRKRLEVNYTYGTEQCGQTIRHTYHCFNEECEKNPLRPLNLQEYLQAYIRDAGASPVTIDYTNSRPAQVLLSPGGCISLDKLPPTHFTHTFFRGRGFDPVWAARRFGVGVCVEPDANLSRGLARLLYNRIIFPIKYNHQQVGFQARYVDPLTGSGMVPNKDVPKYWTSSGFRKTEYVYNYDQMAADKLPFGIVAEGVMMVMKLPWAGASFGKTLSVTQRDKLFSLYKDGALVLLRDKDAKERAEQDRDEMKTYFRGGVACVTPPDDRDFDDWDAAALKRFICEEAARQEVVLAWSQ